MSPKGRAGEKVKRRGSAHPDGSPEGPWRWTVPGHYADEVDGGRWSWPTFEEAVQVALVRVKPIEGCPGDYTRAFVALRVRTEQTDAEVVRLEVFHDGSTVIL